MSPVLVYCRVELVSPEFHEVNEICKIIILF